MLRASSYQSWQYLLSVRVKSFSRLLVETWQSCVIRRKAPSWEGNPAKTSRRGYNNWNIKRGRSFYYLSWNFRFQQSVRIWGQQPRGAWNLLSRNISNFLEREKRPIEFIIFKLEVELRIIFFCWWEKQSWVGGRCQRWIHRWWSFHRRKLGSKLKSINILELLLFV